MYPSSGTPNRTGHRLFPTGRIRSLSLEESNDDPSVFDIGTGTDAKNDAGNPARRRLNTYFNAKDSNGLPIQRSLEEAADEDQQDGPFSESMSGSVPPSGHQATSLIARSELAIFNFLQRHPCYELMPHSSKLVVFDTRLCGRKAFFAMMHNGVSSALLWSAERQTYIGVLTVCDFIRAMCHQYIDGSMVLEDQCIEAWLKFDPTEKQRRMITVGPEDSLARATSLLLSSKLRRLPVCDPGTGNVLCTIAHKHVVRLVYANLSRLLKPRSWFRTLSEIGIGTFTNLATVTPQTKIIDALRLLVDRRISGLPVVSATDGRLLGVFSRADTLVLAIDKAYLNLDRQLSDIMPQLNENVPRPASSVPLRICTLDETLGTIVERVVRGLVHRLIIVDSSRTQVIGVVSLSDILRFFIRAPPASMFLHSPGSSTAPVLFTASGYDILNAPALNQFPANSQSLLLAPSPAACMSFVGTPNGGSHTPTSSSRHQHNSVRLEPSYEDDDVRSEDLVSASLPACPGPAHRLAFADISS